MSDHACTHDELSRLYDDVSEERALDYCICNECGQIFEMSAKDFVSTFEVKGEQP